MNDVIKNKIRQLYQFLKEANQLRFRPVRVLSDQPKVVRLADMPNHPAMQLFRPVRTENIQEVPDLLLRVKRPPLTKCPPPPPSIASWLVPNWDDPARTVSVAESQNTTDNESKTLTIRFDEDPQRVADLKAWSEQRKAWIEPELSARKAMSFFEVFYDIYSAIEKDGEGLELLVADGHFLWKATSGIDGPVTVHHPVLLKRVELRFDPNVPEFTIHETDREPELYGSLFVDLEDVAPAAIRNRKRELETSGYHPLGWDDTGAFLRAFIQTVSPLKGEFLDDLPHDGATATPRLYRDMVLILRKRVAGIANAVDAIIDDIEQQDVFPPSLAQITGTMAEWESAGLGESSGACSAGSFSGGTSEKSLSDDDILLAKEANDEQMQIIRRLEHCGAVIVQGPPGTGKTHTIGNLIGHLLAQGKSILVTAQSAKALRVVREKVPEMLQPLAVSVLGSDQDARRQLESSISSITERLTGNTVDSLLQKAKNFEAERRNLLFQMKQLSHRLREALENEYREIFVGDRHFTPSDAARFVSINREAHDWIPSPIKLGTELNLTEQELVRLYALGTSYTAEEEQDARYPLPEMAMLPSERQFQIMVSEYQHLTTIDLSSDANHWQPSDCGSELLEKLATELAAEFSDDLRHQAWRPYAIVAGIHGGTEREVWERLIADIEEAAEANLKHALVLHHSPRLSEALPVHRQHQISIEICGHIDTGGKLGFLQLATHSEWRHFIKTASVTAGQPSHRDHFEALGHLAELEYLRARLELAWNSMIGQHIQQPFNSLGSAPELACRALVPEIQRCLDWHASVWEPLTAKLKAVGLKLDDLITSLTREATQISEYLVIERLASSILPKLLSTEAGRRKLCECEANFSQLANLATQVDPTSPDRGCIGRIIAAVRSRNPDSYSSALEYTRRLHAVKPLVAERDALAGKLGLIAPGWAEQITHRVPPHHDGKVPGNFAMAWTWRQLHYTLAERDKLDTHELQRQIDRTRETLRQVTQWLIDAKAWGKQLERLQGNPSIRQALVGWLDATKRLIYTRQLDKRQTLLSESRKLMKKCADAVPVWIMPISILAESFDPRATRFDVVIIDEASQADLNALIPLYLGKQVIVVGDHEQVTPLGVGKKQTILENLRKSMLQDIPNSFLFDNLFSIYDIGRESFGDAIRLVEHFRSVPEIIAFSNLLSYEGKIRPLRESNSTDIKPACVGCRVDGVREGDINKAEARRIIDTIKAMIRHPRYTGKTIGIISMLGGAQALLIQSMLHKEISGFEIAKRRIQAGISGEFQGDERDIMFLSMVDSSSDEGQLRTTGEGAFELIKKRYNVAASRARDQMWVMHSFDPDLHLKSSDIRLKLLQHVRDPLASLRIFNQEVGKTESPFERDVLKRLTNAGYRVKSQWQVGYYRIDMVVEGAGKRLAIECDGDRYHPMEKLSDDMERQAILERLGWQFIRIRGSAFYRNPDLAMRPVFDRLEELEIFPEADVGETTASDMTLIHELDELIRAGFGPESDEPENEVMEDVSTDERENDLFAGSSPIRPTDVYPSQTEALLEKLGGTALLETFLRDLANSKGFKRLGVNVRKKLEAELAMLVREGKIAIDGGIIRLL
ncbi:AAA domain-containing protein [Syntrophus aciditrophicus]|uniref:AAA domain-containing protein n=1 Tax=Syntrophus aciditrophicus TaxID=316277 RepID=UPI00130539BD|nr:AAA domain-containing protein [Syntrophus aciditrophicus]